jgi:hypothetical protein
LQRLSPFASTEASGAENACKVNHLKGITMHIHATRFLSLIAAVSTSSLLLVSAIV